MLAKSEEDLDEIEMRPLDTPLLERKKMNVQSESTKDGKRNLNELKKEIMIVKSILFVNYFCRKKCIPG